MSGPGSGPIRVALMGTGNAGRLALRHLIGDERFELTGVWVHTTDKVGTDAGTLAGLDAVTGVRATGDLDELIAQQPDCVVYCAMADHRPGEALRDVRAVLDAGINLVGTAPTTLIYPWGVLPAKHLDPLEALARERGVSLFVSGVDPGFANDLLPLAVASTCREIEHVRCVEVADYATYDGAIVMFDVMGFGASLDDTPLLLLPGVLSSAWGPALRILAAGLGFELDEITERVEREPAPEDFEVAAGTIARGTQAALRFEINGVVDGRVVLTVEHITRLRDDLRPDWRRPAQEGGSYKVEITGEPSYVVDICPTSREGDHNHAAILAGVGRVVNAIPAVVAAEPGLRTTLDLPSLTSSGLLRAAATDG